MWRGREGSSKEGGCDPRPRNRGTWGCTGVGALWFRPREPRVQWPGDGNLCVSEDLLVRVAGAEEMRGIPGELGRVGTGSSHGPAP